MTEDILRMRGAGAAGCAMACGVEMRPRMASRSLVLPPAAPMPPIRQQKKHKKWLNLYRQYYGIHKPYAVLCTPHLNSVDVSPPPHWAPRRAHPCPIP